MRRLLSANLARLRLDPSPRYFSAGMILLASGLMLMQYTAMDYTVPLSRVVFLPLSLYGTGAAAFVSVFVGTDFSDGFIRNKLIGAHSRDQVVLSHILTSCIGCAVVYGATTLFTLAVGACFFENDIRIMELFQFLVLGLGMSAAYGTIFCMITMLSGSKTRAIVLCIVLSMLMLFLCLHTNQVLMQTEYKDGIVNPHYVGGLRRTWYGFLHDINPTGQAAQLSSWKHFNPVRGIACNALWVVGMGVSGCLLFRRKGIK